jgi:TPR repeat protein
LGNGIRIEQNVEAAVKYYRLSAEQGFVAGQMNYGFCLEKGIPIERNVEEAVNYYKLSARAKQLWSLLR